MIFLKICVFCKKSDFINKSIIGRTLSNTDSNDNPKSRSWNDYDHAFYYQLNKCGVEKLFQNYDEVIIR